MNIELDEVVFREVTDDALEQAAVEGQVCYTGSCATAMVCFTNISWCY